MDEDIVEAGDELALAIDFDSGHVIFPDGGEGEVTVMIDKDGYPTPRKSEAFMIIIAHDEGGFIELELDDDQRKTPSLQ